MWVAFCFFFLFLTSVPRRLSKISQTVLYRFLHLLKSEMSTALFIHLTLGGERSSDSSIIFCCTKNIQTFHLFVVQLCWFHRYIDAKLTYLYVYLYLQFLPLKITLHCNVCTSLSNLFALQVSCQILSFSIRKQQRSRLIYLYVFLLAFKSRPRP